MLRWERKPFNFSSSSCWQQLTTIWHYILLYTFILHQVSASQTRQTKESMKDVFTSAPLRKMMVLMVVVYMACAVIFDGLVRMSEGLGLDFFITFTLTSATEIPSVTLLAFVLDKYVIFLYFFCVCRPPLSWFPKKGESRTGFCLKLDTRWLFSPLLANL